LEDQVDDSPIDDNELDGPENGEDEESDPPEASLGSLDAKDDQTAWAAGGRRDLELDPAESGIADFDGLGEQVGSQDWQQGSDGVMHPDELVAHQAHDLSAFFCNARLQNSRLFPVNRSASGPRTEF
jgi:hypothetical protein